VSKRIREVLGELSAPCRACGWGLAVAVETRSAQRIRGWLRIAADRRVTRYENCLDCGVSTLVSTVNSTRVSSGNAIPPGYVAL
jgi:hypothetical protein